MGPERKIILAGDGVEDSGARLVLFEVGIELFGLLVRVTTAGQKGRTRVPTAELAISGRVRMDEFEVGQNRERYQA
jgi:hypothetical protein